MPFPVPDLLDRLRAAATAAVQTLQDLANPALVPALAGDSAARPTGRRQARVSPPDPAPESDPEQDAVLADILALTEELDRLNRRAVPLTGSRRSDGPLPVAGCFWLEG